MSKFVNVAVHRPLKVWPVDMNARIICWTIERNPSNSKHHWTFHSKKVLKSVFCDNKDLNIAKSKKSEQYIREKFETLSTSSMNTLLAILKETRRHNGTRTEQPISLETLSSAPWKRVFKNVRILVKVAFFTLLSFAQLTKVLPPPPLPPTPPRR